ncbi:MAG: TonB-dependent receptor [Candidatus Acidiferrales bacterium]
MFRSQDISFGKKLLVLGAALVVALSVSVTMRAQSTVNGAINGTVEDPTGAIVPNAPVSVENEGTGQKLDETTNGIGGFSFNVLQPGQYTVSVAATGFAQYEQTGVTVEVGRASTVDIHLKVASGTETVKVSGEPPQVDTTDQAIANDIGGTELANLPTNGRRWSSFALLVPGVTPDPDGYQDLDFRGINGYANNNTVDGGDNNQFFFAEERGRTRIAYTLSLDSVEAFQVNTSDYSPQYGRSAGGVINTVTKSGTNQLHGDLFYFYKNNAIGAQNPYTYESELVNGSPENVSIKPPFLRQQYGGSVGGAAIKNKLFFFFTYDTQNENFPIVEIPGPNFLDPITLPTTFTCPATTLSTGASPFVTASASFTQADALYCRGISQAQVNTAMTFLTDFTGQATRTGNQNIEFPKLDWHINPNNVLTLSYNRMRWSSPNGIQTNATADYGTSSVGDDYVHDDMGVARLSSTFSSNVTNEATFVISKDFEFEFADPTPAGEPATGPGGLPPEILISPTAASSSLGAGVSPNSGTLILGTPTFLNRFAYPLEYKEQGSDTLSIVHGTHLFRFGTDINQITDTDKLLTASEGEYEYENNAYALADFITDYTKWTNPTATILGCSVDGATSIPCYHAYVQGFGPPGYKFSTQDVGIFAQDTWRATPRLTINYGLRWDYEPLSSPQQPNANLPQTGTFPTNKANFGPRVGVAWDVFGDGKTSFRAGYGMYYGIISGGTIFDAISSTGIADSQSSDTYTNTSASPTSSTPGEPIFPKTLATGVTSAGTIDFFDPKDRDPLIYEGDVSLQREIGDNFVVTLTYMLTQGRDLPAEIDANLTVPSVNVSYAVSGGPFSGDTFNELVSPGVPCPAPSTAVTCRPDDATLGLNSFVDEFTDLVRSNYNAGAIEISRHLSRGLELESSYTWSHALDNAQGDSGFPGDALLNQFDPGEDYANSAFDVRNRFVLSAVWSPEHFGGDSMAHKLLDGWTVAPEIMVSSNTNYTAGITGSLSSLPGGLKVGNSATTITGQSGSDRFPLLPRGYFTLPSVQNVNLHIGRRFHIGERVVLEADAECFNCFNKMIPIEESGFQTTNYQLGSFSSTAPNYTLTQVNQSTFGAVNGVTDTVFDVRQFQFAGHFTF